MTQDVVSSTAFVFPGQGAQAIGMLRDYAEKEKLIADTFQEASGLLEYDLWQIVCDGPETELNKTDITQPALLTAGVAIWRLWQQNGGITPQYMAGHSLGEYTALVCSGSLDFGDAVPLVRDRGIYMQRAVPAGAGAMAAIIGIGRDAIDRVCDEAGAHGVVSAANYNSPEQTVIAGETAAVNHAMELSKQAGAKRALLLPVSVPSHCQLMQPAADKLAERLDQIDIKNSNIPVIQNVDANPHLDANEIKSALIKQLHQPVLWVDTVNRLIDYGCDEVIESAPGKILSGLIKRINRDMNITSLDTFPAFQAAVTGAMHGN